MIQSILFDKHLWSLQDAIMFLEEHGYKHNKVDETDQYFRFRQISPSILRKKGYTIFRSKKTKKGIVFILAYFN